MASQTSIPDTEISALPRPNLKRPQDVANYILEHLEATPKGAPA